jgi:hypothetical protein
MSENKKGADRYQPQLKGYQPQRHSQAVGSSGQSGNAIPPKKP